MRSTKKTMIQLKRAAAVLCIAAMIAGMDPLQLNAASAETAMDAAENTDMQDQGNDGSTAEEAQGGELIEKKNDLPEEDGSTAEEAQGGEPTEKINDLSEKERSMAEEAQSEELSEKTAIFPENDGSTAEAAQSGEMPEKKDDLPEKDGSTAEAARSEEPAEKINGLPENEGSAVEEVQSGEASEKKDDLPENDESTAEAARSEEPTEKKNGLPENEGSAVEEAQSGEVPEKKNDLPENEGSTVETEEQEKALIRVTVQMENGTEYQGQYYYRADNDMDSSNDGDTAAVTILAANDREEGDIGNLTACLRGTQTPKELIKQASGPDSGKLIFTVEDLKKHFGATEQEITVTVSAMDHEGNRTGLIEKEGTRGVRLEKDGDINGISASFIRDAVPPCVTISYSSSREKSMHVYQRDKNGAEPGTFTAYTCGDLAVTYEVEETYAGNESLHWNISGNVPSDGMLESKGKTIGLTVPEGAEQAYCCTAYGTDLAGNPTTVREKFAEDTEVEPHPGDLGMKDMFTADECKENGDYLPAFHLVIDRKAPEIRLIYTIDTERNPAGTAFIYDDQKEAGNVLTAYLSGKLSARAVVEERGDEVDFSRLFFADPGEQALSWDRTKIGYVSGGPDERYPFVSLASADRDGRYFYRVFGTDRAGNNANVTELFEDGSRLEKMFTGEKKLEGKLSGVGENYIPYYVIVIDTASPVISEIVTRDLGTDGKGNLKEGEESSPCYYEDDGTFYYKSRGLRTIWKIDEPDFDSARISAFWKLDGRVEEQSGSGGEGEILLTFRKEGKYTDISVRGTDRAGNHIILDSGLASSASAGNSPEGTPDVQSAQNAARTVRESENEGKDRYGLPDTHVELTFPRIIDRQSPTAVITHIVPARTTGYLYHEQEGESTAAMYCSEKVTTLIRISDTYGKGEVGKTARLDSGKVNVNTMFHLSGQRFSAHAAGTWNEQKSGSEILSMKLRTKEEGYYAFTLEGTDRAGNPVTVQESIADDPGRGALLNVEKGRCKKEDPHEKTVGENEIYSSCYVIVYDKTPPVYSLIINHPRSLQETFDPKTGIVYYGRSVFSIQAKFIVTEQNFDDERILAGTASKSSSGVKSMENLFPEWSTPDVKGKGSVKNGVTTAVFPLEVPVDRQHEGMYRFEIAGCDKAGNMLVPSSAQVKADSSDELTDLAARTVPCKNAEGGYWTQRKAIDVTAPKGVMKVHSVRKQGEIYYEIRFEAGQNVPVRYEPFRRELKACLAVETEDCSPTSISLDLRSLDNDKDAVLKRSNPLTGAGKEIYRPDNSLEVTVDGEQVFYVENLIIRDRAGNVRANDPGSAYTLAKSGNIYLDATEPSVSEIRDAESPLIKIAASGSFTRHEGDGERFIYRPDGAALDLEVTISDPGGRAHSSGLKEVTVEVRVGDRVVTDKIGLRHLPYTYEKGSRTGHNTLRYDISDGLIRIPAGSFAESNDITVTVRAQDNSGNESVPARDGGLLKLGIDTTAPRVEVNYHDTVEPMHGRYFRADRIAEIVVVDRNVENSSIRIRTNTSVPSFFTAPHNARERDGKGESGNEDRWSKTLLYNNDGDYTLQISGTDALGNRISDIKWNGPAPGEFTIDKTRPVIRVLLPGEVNEKDGVKYYDRPAEAVIEIREHNFIEKTETELLRVGTSVSSRSGAEAPAVPRRTAFRCTGVDVYTSVIPCGQDGDYEITASYTDPAGNTAVAEGGENRQSEQEAWSGRFVVDTAAPELRLDPETFRVDSLSGKPLEGMENQIYTDRDFAPRVIIRDINYDEEESDFSVKTYGTDQRTEDLIRKEGDAGRGEYSLQFKKFEVARRMDGVYKVTARAADLAKHQTSLEFVFSVNRFGSTWIYADEATEQKMDAYYINDTKEPLKILEISPVELGTHTVEVFKDHDRRILSDGVQYTFGTAQRAGGKSQARVYLYTIAPEIYEEEGIYDFILSSSDLAGNKNSTALFREGTVKDGEVSRVKFPIELQVDKTVPVNRITGVKSGQEQFNAERLKITVYPEDYQTDIRQVELRVWKGAGKGKDISPDPEQYMCYREIDEKEDRDALARQHIFPIEDAGKGIPVTLKQNGKWQYLEVITTDLAGNESMDLRAGDPERNLPDTRRRFFVTTNPLIRFYSCKPVFYGAIAGILFSLILFFCFKKQRKEAQVKDV